MSTAVPAAATTGGAVQPLIGFGQVRHERLRPAANVFSYPTFFLLLPLRSMAGQGSGALARNRAGWLSFHDSDHGQGGADCLAWIDELLASEGLSAPGEVWLHTYPRVLGYTFKPVSFWYCHDEAGQLRVIVVEVNNTFGERHCYLLDAPRLGAELGADKVFHVSPFAAVEGAYRFRFMVTPQRDRTVARVDWHDALGPVLQTSVSGRLEPICVRNLRHAAWGGNMNNCSIGAYGYGATMAAWNTDYLAFWAGHDGMVRHAKSDFRTPAFEGDVTFFEGEVVDKIENSQWGFPVVQVKVKLTDQNGRTVVSSLNEVELPY